MTEKDQTLAAAQQLVNEYGRILEAHAHEMLKSEEVLPASKDEIMRAILRIASIGMVTGQMTEESLEHLRIGYASLADFVPASEARGARQFAAIIQRTRQKDDWSDEDVHQLAREVADSGYSPTRYEGTDMEFRRLIEEFDKCLAILVDKLSREGTG